MEIAVIGLGMMGRLHCQTLAMIPGVSATGFDIDPRARTEAEAEGIPVAELSAGPDRWQGFDGVVIALPDHLHVDITIDALKAGIPVLVEKPLAATTADCDRILAAAPRPERLMVGHVLRFDERLRELRRRIGAGDFGRLHHIRIHRANTTMSAVRVGGRVSVVGFLGVHDIDLLLWLTGQDVVTVTARGRRLISPNWDVVNAHLELADGTTAQVDNHWLLHRASARSCLAGIELFGEGGSALLDLSSAELEVITDADPRSIRVDSHNWTHDPQVSGGSLHRQDRAFVDAVRAGGPMPVLGSEARAAVAVVERIELALDSPGGSSPATG